MKSLYKLKDEYLALENMDSDDDKDFSEALENSMLDIKDDFNEKGISIIKMAKNVKSQAAAIDVEIKNMQARKSSLLNKDKALREYLKINMIDSGISKISCPFFEISIRGAKEAVIIDSVEDIPKEYKEYEVIEKVPKNALYAALKAGVVIKGAHLKENKSLTIK
jgi:uncharacterized protein with gpF-like domain